MTATDKYAAVNASLRHCLTQCAAGKTEAFSDLYALTAPKFMAILMKMVRDEAECADILQEAYLSIWKNAHRYDASKGKPFTWMLVITRNKALDRLRAQSRKRATETISGEIIETLEDEGRSPHEAVQNRMVRHILAPYLSQLRPEIARAILLSTTEGLSAREIGERLNVPTNTVKSWIRRGLKRIRAELEQSPARDQLHKLIY